VATELDPLSIVYAQLNVQENGLQDRITVVKAGHGEPILLPLLGRNMPAQTYDFTMCNPPFYESRDEILRSAEAKDTGPNAVCTGADVEMITTGGESAFVCQMIRESIQVGAQCRWYTSMLGKMSSLFKVVKLLSENKIENYAVTEFVQGQTRRWAIAWSFTNIRLPESIARFSSANLQSIMPVRNTLHRSFRRQSKPQDTVQQVIASIDGVSIKPTYFNPARQTDMDILVYASGNTWSRAARRRRRAETDVIDVPMQTEEESPRLVCRMRWTDVAGSSAITDSVVLTVDWVQGDDRGLFDSFTNHVWRKIDAELAKE